MHEADRQPAVEPPAALTSPICQSIDWYSEGEQRMVELAGVRVIVRYVGRKGRRARILIEAPAGAVFGDYLPQDERIRIVPAE